MVPRKKPHMQPSDPFAGSSSGYDPSKVWFMSHDPAPPYERESIRMYFPSSEMQALRRFLVDDSSRTFTSVQQILRNAFYHGFHHMQEQQRFTVIANLSRLHEQTLKAEEKYEVLRAKSRQVDLVRKMRGEAHTDEDLADVKAFVSDLANEQTDIQHAKRIWTALEILKDWVDTSRN
jgi:hypothetical protein